MNFLLRVPRNRKETDGSRKSDFFNLTVFGDKRVDSLEKYLHKGDAISVTAEARNDNYTNNKGENVYGFQFVVDELQFCTPITKDETKDSSSFESVTAENMEEAMEV